MTAAHARRRTLAALAVGITLGATASCGIALLLYTGQGFLRAAGLLISSTIMAVAAGLWAGAPEPPHPARNRPPRPGEKPRQAGSQRRPREPGTPATDFRIGTRGRWMLLLASLIAGGLFAAFWNARPPLHDAAWGGAVAVLLALAMPAYAAGTLLAALHARDNSVRGGIGAIAASAMAGSAFGTLLATTALIPNLDAYVIYYGGAALLAVVSLFDRGSGAVPLTTGVTHMIDRVVIVTGTADRGQLGYVIAERFLQAGAHVVISARSDALDEAAASLAQRGDVIAVRADLTSDDDVARIIATVRERFGRLDALVNVAGGLSVVASVEDTTPAEWQREIERNAGTALRLSRAALPLLRESRGAIINFASPAALRAPAKLAAYSAAKAAVVALTRSLAIEEKKTGVRVNAIAPGMMDTAQNRAETGEDVTYVSRDDVASVALFLAGPAAAAITGETIHVLGDTIR